MRALGQKYMGIRPEKINEEMFKIEEVSVDGGHSVPVSVCTPIDQTYAPFFDLLSLGLDLG